MVGRVCRKICSSSLCCPQKRYSVFCLAPQCNVYYFYAGSLSETQDPKFILEDATQAAQSNSIFREKPVLTMNHAINLKSLSWVVQQLHQCAAYSKSRVLNSTKEQAFGGSMFIIPSTFFIRKLKMVDNLFIHSEKKW